MGDHIRFRSFYELWPQGLSSLRDEARALGFKVSYSGALDEHLAQSPEYLKSLRVPRTKDFPEARYSDFTFLGPRNDKTLPSRQWGLVVVDEKNEKIVSEIQDCRLLIVNEADAFMDYILRKTVLPEWHGDSHPLPLRVHAEAQVHLGPDSHIGEGTIIETGVRIGARVRIGKNCRLGAHSRIADDSVLGDHCVLTSHVSIGGQGFGFVKYPLEAQKRPRLHVGRVVVGSRVRLGSFVAIDRGVFEDTILGSESALDNIVQLAHNTRTGKNAVFCSFVGISGSTQIGDRVTIAGMSGTKDHVTIGHDVTIAAQSGISRDLKDKEVVKGYPPRPLKEALEISMLQSRLPEIWSRLKNLEKTVTAQKSENKKTESSEEV